MRVVLVWLGCALALAAVACEDKPTSPALVSPSPTADATQATTTATTPTPTASPEPTPTAAPTSTPGVTPSATPIPSPSPTPVPTASHIATPEAPAVEVTRITRRASQPLPADVALYYWIFDCMPCDVGPIDLRRVFFDEAVGALREDRPLAFFDGARYRERDNPVGSFGVSKSGQTLAATVCHAAVCEVDTVGGAAGPSARSELRLWVTQDGGATWEDWGELLPQTRIIEVTDDDVLVETWNVWAGRELWSWLTDDEWDEMLARFAPLGLDQLDEWEKRATWVMSGKAHRWPAEPPPPAVEGVDRWSRLSDQPPGTVAWSGAAQGRYLLALTDESGAVERVYSSKNSVWGSFIANDVLAVPTSPQPSGVRGQVSTLDLVDLSTSHSREVQGLTLPLGFDPHGGEPQREFYHFITARPAPAPATARPAIEYSPLTLGEPRELPNGVELYFADWPYEGFANGVARVIRSAGGFTTDRPWAIWDDSSVYVTSFQVSDDGRTMAAAVCEQGFCLDCYVGPTEDASLRLRVSRDGGVDWEDWGELPQGAYIEAVTADDVAVTVWEPTERLWWFRSGEDVRPPAGFPANGVRDWSWRTGSGFVWDYGGNARVTDSASVLLPPPPAESLKKSTGWYLQEVRRDAWSLWLRYEQDAEHYVLMGDGGEVADTFSWSDESTALSIVGFLSDDILIGQLRLRSWDRTETPTTVLVDLSNHTVHQAEGLDDVELGHCDCLWFVRPGAEEPVVVEGARRGGPL